jgi:hypothetical protein
MSNLSRLRRSDNASDQRGATLLTVVFMGMTIAVMTIFLVESTAGVSTRTARHGESIRLEAIADAAIELSMHHLWNQYKTYLGGKDNSLRSFRKYLDAAAIAEWEPEAGSKGDFHLFGEMTYREPQWVNLYKSSGLPTNVKNAPSLDGANVLAIEVLREDGSQSTALRVRATVSFGTNLSVAPHETSERV